MLSLCYPNVMLDRMCLRCMYLYKKCFCKRVFSYVSVCVCVCTCMHLGLSRHVCMCMSVCVLQVGHVMIYTPAHCTAQCTASALMSVICAGCDGQADCHGPQGGEGQRAGYQFCSDPA